MPLFEKSKASYRKKHPVIKPCKFGSVLSRELQEIRKHRGEDLGDKADDPIEDAHNQNLYGIALSGGGIRSATFNLGVLEALAQFRLIKKVDYVSTESGGGDIGGWLTAWIKRDGQNRVQKIPGRRRPPEKPRVKFQNEVSVDPYPITHLRRYTNYLTPHLYQFQRGNEAMFVAN